MVDFERINIEPKQDTELFFSVLIPSYGNIQYLDECLDSIVKNNFKSYEIIICDQGNTDSSIIASKYEKVRIIRLEKPSSYLARLELIKEANGQYLIFSDNDDLLHPNALKILNKSIISLNYPDMIIYELDVFSNNMNIDAFDSKMQTIEAQIIDDYVSFLLGNNDRHNSMCQKCFKRSKVRYMYNIDIFQADDICASLQFHNQMNAYYHLNQVLYFYRRHNTSGTRVWKFNRILDISKFYYYVFNEFPYYVEKEIPCFCKFVTIYIMNGQYLEKFGKSEWRTLFSDKYFLECFKKIKSEKNIYKNKSFKEKILIYCLKNKKYYLMKIIAKIYFGNKKNKEKN